MELRSEVEVAALIRRAQVGGAFAAVVTRGDPDFGSILVKIASLDGRARLYSRALGPQGDRRWIDPLGRDDFAAESDIDAYLERARARDPDLWVVEIEDKQGRSFLI